MQLVSAPAPGAGAGAALHLQQQDKQWGLQLAAYVVSAAAQLPAATTAEGAARLSKKAGTLLVLVKRLAQRLSGL